MIPTDDHFSGDLETLSNKYDSAIISIGFQQFDPNTGKLGATFYREIDFNSAAKYGRVTGDTLAWWMSQGDKARRVFTENKKDKVSLPQALDELATWMRGRAIAPKVWGNGATFGVTILEHAYDKGCVGLVPPWHYTNVRDMRTAVDMAGLTPGEWPKREGVHHNALDDAVYQAKVISACWMKIRRQGIPPLDLTPVLKTTKGKAAAVVNEDEDL